MSTHAYIGLENPDGSVDYIFCRLDGYPKYMRPMLSQFWASLERVRLLLSLGDIDALKETPQECKWRSLELNGPVRAKTVEEYAQPPTDGSFVYLYRAGEWTILTWAPQWQKLIPSPPLISEEERPVQVDRSSPRDVDGS